MLDWEGPQIEVLQCSCLSHYLNVREMVDEGINYVYPDV